MAYEVIVSDSWQRAPKDLEQLAAGGGLAYLASEQARHQIAGGQIAECEGVAHPREAAHCHFCCSSSITSERFIWLTA
jgi:hypothetical protein